MNEVLRFQQLLFVSCHDCLAFRHFFRGSNVNDLRIADFILNRIRLRDGSLI